MGGEAERRRGQRGGGATGELSTLMVCYCSNTAREFAKKRKKCVNYCENHMSKEKCKILIVDATCYLLLASRPTLLTGFDLLSLLLSKERWGCFIP